MQKQMSMKEKVLLCIVAVAVVIAVFVMFILKPQQEEIVSMQNQLADKQKEVSQYANFDKTIEDTNKEVGEYKTKVANAVKDWHDTDIQNDIIKDLEDKIQKSNLYDTNITFTNLQQMSITQKNAKVVDETPSLSESLAMAYLCITQEEKENAKKEDAKKQEKAEDTKKDDAKKDEKADLKASATPAATTAPKNAKGAEAGGMILNPEPVKATQPPELDPKVSESFEAFKKSLAGLSDAEVRAEVEKIMAKSKTNIEKLDVSISFQDSKYQSIYEFMNRIEEASPKIYITSVNYNDSTEAYVDKLNELLSKEKSEAEQNPNAVNQPGFFENQYPSASVMKSQINEGAVVTYNGEPRYTGTITISYFSLVKMPLEEMEDALNKIPKPDDSKNSKKKSEQSEDTLKL